MNAQSTSKFVKISKGIEAIENSAHEEALKEDAQRHYARTYTRTAKYYEVHAYDVDGSVCLNYSFNEKGWRGYDEAFAKRVRMQRQAAEVLRSFAAQNSSSAPAQHCAALADQIEDALAEVLQ